MKWYTGSIPEAVTHAQAKQSLFCVVIVGTDDNSVKLLASLESEAVQESIVREDVIAIQVDADSEEYRQFGAIYSNVSSPSIYCITKSGVTVEVIYGPLDSNELKERFELAISRHRETINVNSNPTQTTAPPVFPVTTADAVQTFPTSVTTAAPSQQVSATALEKSPIEERIERAKRLAAAKQQQKREEEAQEAKRLEAERREAGKKVAELKRWQDDEETKRVAEERRKDKKEEAALRQRLREQIAQDRIDREVRANANKAPTNETSREATAPVLISPASSISNVPNSYNGLARLQFRLPDGSSHTHAFEPTTTLGAVREYLTSTVAVPAQGFSIWVAFPRRELSSSDYDTTLLDLELLPTATLLIIPGLESNRVMSRVGGGAGGIISMFTVIFLVLFSPFTYIWSFLRPSATKDDEKQGTASTSSGGRSSGNTLGGTASGQQDNRVGQRIPPGGTRSDEKGEKKGGESFGKQDGNIRRLRTTENDSDDELGTYNGNSTQQM